MQVISESDQSISQWVTQCFELSFIQLERSMKIKQSVGREVWDCTLKQKTVTQEVIVTVFKPSPPDTVNATLPAIETAQKCAWAMQELPTVGVWTPKVLGLAVQGESAAVVVEKVTGSKWQPQTRVLAAQSLARLHNAALDRLSPKLQRLIYRSDPKQQRVHSWFVGCAEKADKVMPTWRASHPGVAAEVQEVANAILPSVLTRTLVHGDYFSANIIPTSAGICILDWETLALGDPMWDLAFLLGADKNLKQQEVDTCMMAYASIALLDPQRLRWYKQCWDMGWRLIKLIKQYQSDSHVS